MDEEKEIIQEEPKQDQPKEDLNKEVLNQILNELDALKKDVAEMRVKQEEMDDEVAYEKITY